MVDLTRGFSATNVNWEAIRNIMFMVSPGDVTNHGSFWLDDVAVTRAPNEAPLEPFEADFYGWAGGGAFTNLGISTQHFQNSGTPFSLGQQSLKITWDPKTDNYDNFTYTPLHDTNAPAARVGMYTNLNLYGNTLITLWVKSTTDNGFPILMKLTGAAGTNDLNTFPQYYEGNGEWQQLMWWFEPYSNIAASLETVWIFPYAGMADDGGTMYIDNLGLATSSASIGPGPVLPLAPTGFVAIAGTPDEDGRFALQWQPVFGATNYILQQDNNINFTNPVSLSTTGTIMNVSMDPVASEGAYYYRVRSVVDSSAGTFTAPLRVRVHRFPEADRKREVIADFDSLGQVLAWWGSDTAAPWTYDQDFQSTAHVHSGANAMRVVFNKANDVTGIETNAYSFFSASGCYNFLNFDYLSFWVYNTGTPLRIKVRLEQLGDFNKAWETDWAAIYPEMTTTQADWENITVDLTRAFFGHAHGDIDLTKIGQIMFMVEPGSTSATGEFWMDDIALHRAAHSAPLEVFESDFYGWAAGAPFAITNTTEEAFNDGGVYGLGQRSLKISWGAKARNYSNITYEPVHDTNGAPANRIGMYSNFVLGGQSTIELRIKSTTDATIPILLKFDDADVGFQTYTGSGAWQNVRWEIDTVPGGTSVNQLYVIPYPNTEDDGGVMYVDDLNLAGGTVPAVPYAPTGFRTMDPDLDGGYSVTWDAVANATSYEVQEDADPNFGSPTSLYTNATAFLFSKDPLSEEGVYYYRVRSATAAGGYGSFTAPIRVLIVPEAVAQEEVLADFENAGAIGAWWGSDPAEPWVYQQDFANTDHAHSGELAMKVVYDKANEVRTNEFNEPYTNGYSFMAASGLFNMQPFDYFSFWVYNTGTPLRIKIRFEQYGDYTKAWETDWAAIFPQMATTQADWENICIDLTRSFYGQTHGDIDMTKIGQIMFMVEPCSDTAAGEFWMDDITLRRAPNSAPLEPFESDMYGWAGGGAFTNLSLTNEVFHNDGLPFGLGQASLKVVWDAKAPGYDNFTYEVGHDTNNAPLGRVGNYHDFTLYSNRYVALWVRSPTDATIPILLKLDEADLGVVSYCGTGEWQRLVWSYAGVPGATNVDLVYVIPYPNAADNGGTMYVDDLNLFGGQAAPIPLAPTRFRTTAKNPEGDGTYQFRWDAAPGAMYEFEEDEDSSFGSPSVLTTAVAQVTISRNPQTQAGVYHYRVRSVLGANKSSYAAALPVTIHYQPAAQLHYENLDTFDGEKQIAFWWANDPVAPFAYTLDFGSTEHVHSGVVALKVDYDKNNDPNVFSFMSAGGLFNFRNHDYLSFWVYNDGRPLKFRIRLEDNAGGYFESNWAAVEPETRTPAADWENLVFDLSRTYNADSIDMTAVAQIMFMVAPENGTNAGTFWMDDVQLQRAPNSAPIEPFESDFYGWNGASHFAMELSAEARHNEGSRTNIGQQALRVSWTNKPQDYSSIQYDPGHDAGSAPVGRIGNFRNFRDGSNYLVEVWFMSPTEFKMPILMKLDDADVGIQNYTGEGEWEKLTWDISGVSGATNVELMFFLPYPNRADAEGVFYVDDINLAGGTPWQAPQAPATLGASYPEADGQFVLSWTAVANVTGYQVLEAANGNFAYPTEFYTTNLTMLFSHHPTNDGGTYYYRVRSCEVVDGVTNVGGYSAAVSVYIPQLDRTPGFIENRSYDTMCAEVDNINIPLWHTNTSAYRITVTHPEYFPVTINERGADFDDCHFTDRSIWKLGTNNGSSAEFRPSGYGDGDVYYALDYPTAGVDEAWSEFPAALDSAVIRTQVVVFTAEELGDVNLEPMMGSRLTVAMRAVTGTLEVRLVIGNGSTWAVVSNQVFDSSHLVRQWNTPDFFWAGSTDANRLRLEVVTAEEGGQTTPGARADYDVLELWKRDEGGELPPVELVNVPEYQIRDHFAVLYDDGNIIVEAIRMDFWWRAPEAMTVITPQGSVTDAQYFRIVKRVSDSNVVEYSQVFVMYEDGNVRLLPHPPAGVDWTPFGASVILGPTVEGPRPFAGISTVTVHPKDLSMDIEYDNGGSCHLDMWVNRERNVVDVSDIQYATISNSFARFRSMWAYDGKADIDRAENADGVYPATRHWSELHGTWWKFFKEVPTYHNTYCPEFDVEVTDPIKAFLVRQAEAFDAANNCAVALRTGGKGGEAINIGETGGEARYDVYLDRGRPNTHMVIRYADDDGGNNGDYPGNSVRVYVDGVLKGQTYSMNSDGWNDFDLLPAIELGDLMPGWHTIQIVVGAGTFGLDVDEFQLISRPEALRVRDSVLTRQAESYDGASNVVDAVRSGAVGGHSIHMEQSNSVAMYHVTLAAAVTQAYMRVRYSDDVGPTMLKIYIDGVIKARCPTLDTGTWDDFGNSPELYMGDLAAGVHTVRLACSEETWGFDADEFEIYTKCTQNRAPQFTLPAQYDVPIQTTTNIGIYAYDGDGDEVTVASVSIPANSGFDGRYLLVTTTVADVGTTNAAAFTADDGRGAPNSSVAGSTKIVVPSDWDTDTLPDTWEWSFFTSLGPSAFDDPDDDGAANLHEYLAGTSPNAQGSVFKLSADSPTMANGFSVDVLTEPGRQYVMWVADGSLGTGTVWRTFGDLSNGVGAWDETNTVSSHFTFVDDFTASTGGAVSNAGIRYYRVKTSQP